MTNNCQVKTSKLAILLPAVLYVIAIVVGLLLSNKITSSIGYSYQAINHIKIEYFKDITFVLFGILSCLLGYYFKSYRAIIISISAIIFANYIWPIALILINFGWAPNEAEVNQYFNIANSFEVWRSNILTGRLVVVLICIVLVIVAYKRNEINARDGFAK